MRDASSNPDSTAKPDASPGNLPAAPFSRSHRTTLSRYLRMYGALVKNSVIREMGFKVNFLMWIVVELGWFLLQLVFISVIYRHTQHIGTWTQWEVILLVGVSHFIQQIFSALFLTNCAQLSESIRTGRLDFMLLLPINTRFLISLRQVDLGGFVNALSAVAVMVYAGHQLRLQPTLGMLGGFLLLSLAGVIIHYSLMLSLASTSFWTIRAQGIVWGYYNLFNVARLPDAAFHGFFKVFFTWIIPMLLVANVPAKVLIQRLDSPLEMGLLLVMASLCFALSEGLWRLALRHYTSASS